MIRSGQPVVADQVATAEFCTWIEPFWPSMRRIAWRLAPAGEGEDVLQNALLTAWKHRGRFDAARGTPAAWLATLTVNEARKSHRALRRTPQITYLAESSDPLLRLDLQNAIAALPARQALAVNLFYYADLSLRETAAAMRCAEGTVKSTLSAARAALHLILEEDTV